MRQARGGKQAFDGDLLVVPDLLSDLTEIAHRLIDRVAAQDVLDTYLLAAAAVQIVEDHLQRDTYALSRAAAYLRDQDTAAIVADLLRGFAAAGEMVRTSRAGERRAVRWRDAAATLRDAAALQVVTDAPQAALEEWTTAAVRLRASLTSLDRGLAGALLRLPSCFRSFDQEPADMVALATRLRPRCPDRGRPIVVLGVRTSGSYLAPLVAAALRDVGYGEVHAESVRPGYRLRPPVRALLRSAARRGGRIAVVDDPPETGQSVADVASTVRRAGVPESAVTLLLPLFGDAPPATLAGYDSVTLPYREWAIHERLETEAVVRSLSALLDQPVRSVSRVPHIGVSRGREHARAVFDVGLPDGESRRIVAAGAGLGFFGRHALAVAHAVSQYLPRTYGFVDGIVFRDWLPSEQKLANADTADAQQLAGYVRDRAAAMPAGADHAAGLAGRQPVWEAASRVLQRNYGRAGVVLRPVLLDPLIRRLCKVAEPSVVDGATGLDHWFRGAAGLYKVDADVRDFANTDLACYDPAYDLAGIDPGSASPAFAESLRREMPCDPERFLLYELVHLWDRERQGHPAHRAGARAVQRYLREVLLTGVHAAPGGAVCALDVDGVLESEALGFPMATPTAALTLRALLAHGFRPVLVTGRCLDEVRERCRSYGLAGGVAEYGSVVFHDGTAHDLVPADAAKALDRVRAALTTRTDVVVDADYQRIVRAYRRGSDGVRRALPARVTKSLLAQVGDAASHLRVIVGDGQTDFVATAVGKGTGLALLAASLGVDAVSWAVGDTAADLPMLEAATVAYAPGNADERVRSSTVQVLRRHYAAGVEQAAKLLIGHRPGACETCRPPVHAARTRTLLTLLDASNAGARGLPVAVARCLSRAVSTG
ncbi:HAD hydrolase family protein [Amycolatopsis sp. FDAARGOS 1241]|uniref:HAD hydrolase family protein n=1 Tax=Amycolatopsis sp. FDAARGOS 1241 TaxID=2778070 RepID=UPI00194E2FCC|nr:HAD hydrolase family protein [Amycolatopsis sp. FDAARGOS 1241]QRP47878.1 HAD hydrolase family protein [Amycolatopsis sp. FDAARGOS 1241]